MDLNPLIKQWTRESKRPKVYVENLTEACKVELIEQGLEETNPKFYPYLIIKMKKKLKIESNSVTLKRFKTFLDKEN